VLDDGTPYLVMERLRGKDLRARLGEGPLSLEEARAATVQVASALALAHREGVVHRDLKPENIFLCEQGDGSVRVKILDFGISKIQASGTHATRDDRILGTPGYMAPEQAMGKNSAIDGRTDLFALAAIFYEMLTGQSVFLGTTLAEVVYKVVHHTPEPLSVVTPDVPAAISSAVQQALSKDPAERQPSVQAFVAALTSERPAPFVSQAPAVDAYGGTVAVSTGDERLSAQASTPTPRSARAPKAAWFAGGALAILALGLGAWALLRPSAQRPEPRGPPAPEAPAAPAPPLQPAAAPPMQDAAASPEPPVAATPESPRRAHEGEDTRKQVVPPSVRAALEQAEGALRAGDFAGALRLARSSLYEVKSAQAYAIMAQAYCGQHDVGMAAAMLRNLRGREQRAPRAYCEKLGIKVAR
jgi:serine/threonine-protein kinase